MIRTMLLSILGLLLIFPTPSLTQDQSRESDREELWLGTLDMGIAKLRLLVKLKPADDDLHGVMISLDQGKAEIPIDRIVRNEERLEFTVNQIKGSFEGELNTERTEAEGKWTQFGQATDLTLRKVDDVPDEELKPRTRNRPQTPKPPFSYRATEVQIDNQADGVKLAGTLTLPPDGGPFPAVVLITGSGPQDRDETLLGHKPFLVLADHLTRRGIAVLRFDDRGFGKSTGDHSTATSADFANDVRAVVQRLSDHREVDRDRIGLIGHSEGGLIAPMVASDSDRIAFVVLMAGPGVTGAEILRLQARLISQAMGVSEAEIDKSLALQREVIKAVRAASMEDEPKAIIQRAVDAFLAHLPEDKREDAGVDEMTQKSLQPLASPWFRFFLDHDPRPVLKKVRCDVLAVNGEFDLQVAPDQNLPEIKKALQAGGNQRFQIIELPKLNHLFQTSQNGSPAEYNDIEETIAPLALKTISDWILNVTNSETQP